MNIVVTGGAGFIGSHLCERLWKQGHVVVCVDNLFTGSRRNIAPLLAQRRFRFIQHDIIEPLYIPGAIHQIYNLACPASPIHYQINPIRTVKANTIGMINVLGLSRKKKARLLQASTSEVYGDPLEHPQQETYRGNVNPIGPRACYDEGKRIAETLVMDYHRQHRMDIRIARIFNTYGPRMARDDGRVVSNFIVQALRKKSLTVYGSGSQTRSFCYVDDLIGGLLRLMNNRIVAQPINLGNPEEFTITELARQIQTLTGFHRRVVYKPLPEDDPRQRQPDITLAKKKLGWQPTVPLKEGLEKTIEYFKIYERKSSI